MRLLLLAALLYCATSYGKTGGIRLPSGVRLQVAALLTAGIFAVAPLSAANDPAWHRVSKNPPAHHASTFYLLIEGDGNGWQVMHTELVGLNRKNEPLLAGLRVYIFSNENAGRGEQGEEWGTIFDVAELNLVGHRGAVVRDAEVEEVAHFKHPQGEWYDQTLLTIKGVDFRRHTPITIAPYPPVGTALEMLSYRVDRDNLLKLMSYPLHRRDCQALGFDAKASVGNSTCILAKDTLLISGAPIFTKDDGELIAFYYSEDADGISKAITVLPELQLYMRRKLAVTEQGKIATLWGKIKAGD